MPSAQFAPVPALAAVRVVIVTAVTYPCHCHCIRCKCCLNSSLAQVCRIMTHKNSLNNRIWASEPPQPQPTSPLHHHWDPAALTAKVTACAWKGLNFCSLQRSWCRWGNRALPLGQLSELSAALWLPREPLQVQSERDHRFLPCFGCSSKPTRGWNEAPC